MDQSEAVWQTRRSFLALAIGALTAGCASTTGLSPRAPSSCGSPKASGFPYPRPWGWDTSWNAPLDQLGKLIMQTRNPYCQNVQTPTALPLCTQDDAKTWPQELTDATTWKVLTEFDFQSATWRFQGSPVIVERSMRIPYLVTHRRAKHGKDVEVGRENLLVGFESTNGSFSGAKDWGAPTQCSGTGQGDGIGLLAEFITINMMRSTDTAGFFIPLYTAEPDTNTTNVAWTFRQSQVNVDYPFRFPVATGDAAAVPGNPGTPRTAGRIYVGYEGGGAY